MAHETVEQRWQIGAIVVACDEARRSYDLHYHGVRLASVYFHEDGLNREQARDFARALMLKVKRY